MNTVVFAALVWQVVDFLRELANFRVQKSAVLTQLTAWVGGVALVILGAHAMVAQALVLPGTDAPLGSLDFASQVFAGLLVASVGSSLVDIKQAIDNNDSASKPPLVKPIGETQ